MNADLTANIAKDAKKFNHMERKDRKKLPFSFSL